MSRVCAALLIVCAIGAAQTARAGQPTRVAPTPPAPTAAPAPVAAPAIEDPYSIFVVTFGPGDHPFFKFGHDALLVRDRSTHQDRVYNFGTFRFAPGLIGEFLKGRLMYWLSVSPLAPTIASYAAENRTILLQELALSPEAKRDLVERLDVNARPENREYKYDYFLDNCSTRVRDAVDRATGGALHAVARAPGRFTLRDQALRMTADTLPLYLGLDLILGGSTDRPIDRWAEMYIPEELERGLRTVQVPGPAGPRPLVASEQMVFPASRPPPLDAPPARFVSFLLVGLGIALAFVALGWAAHRRPVRALLGLTVAIWGLASGFVGCFLLYAWIFTDHVVAHRNENIFLCAPWAVALFALGLGVSFGSQRMTLAALRVAVASLLLALLGWGLKAHPAFHQHNATLMALLLPPWFGISIGLLHARHHGG
jgi:hypothetical protein